MANDQDVDAPEIAIEDTDISSIEAPKGPAEGEDPVEYWKKQSDTFQGMATRRGTKLNKFKTAPKPAPKKKEDDSADTPKPGELDYAQKAYLIASGVKGEKETALIQEALKSGTYKDLDAVLVNPFVQGQLKEIRDEAATEAATPKGGDRGGNGPAANSVEYWIKKGGLPPATPENKKLREDIVNARVAAGTSGSNFASVSVVQ